MKIDDVRPRRPKPSSITDAASQKNNLPRSNADQRDLTDFTQRVKLNPIQQTASSDSSLRPKKQFSKTKKRFLKIIAGLLLLILLAGLAYFVYQNYWLKPNESSEQIKQDPVARQEAEGKDESEIGEDKLAAYQVASDEPRILYIDKIKVAARILPMGVNPNGTMQAPLNIFDSGWYSSSAKPGNSGAVVMNAHASGPTREGLFAYLDTLNNGDQITIELGSGQKINYKIVKMQTVDLEKINMQEVLLPFSGVQQGLNLITCTGKWNEAKKTFDQRLLVFAERSN